MSTCCDLAASRPCRPLHFHGQVPRKASHIGHKVAAVPPRVAPTTAVPFSFFRCRSQAAMTTFSSIPDDICLLCVVDF